MLTIEEPVTKKYPDLHFGIIVMENVQNPKTNAHLNQMKRMLEIELRQSYKELDRKGLKNLPPIQAYSHFYKIFKKTYHVLHQIDSIVLKDKNLPNVAALVEAMFMAEVKNLLLTAGYNYDKVATSVQVKLADGNRSFIGMGGREKRPPQNDIVLCDHQDILGSIICGPDHARRITPETTRVLFAVYGVPGISKKQINEHLLDIEHNVKVISPKSTTTHKAIE